MSTNPFPEKAVFHEMPYRAIMDAHAPEGFTAPGTVAGHSVPLQQSFSLPTKHAKRRENFTDGSSLFSCLSCVSWAGQNSFVEIARRCVHLHLLIPFVIGERMQFSHQLAVFAR